VPVPPAVPGWDDAAIVSLLDGLFDHACAQPLSAFVDADRFVSGVAQSITAERTKDLIERIALPARARWMSHAAASAIPLGAWLPDRVQRALSDLLRLPVRIPPVILDEFVASERIRDGVRTLLQETLANFVAGMTGGSNSAAGSGASAGLRDAIGWGARVVGAAGRGLLGALGEELQKQLQSRAREFVDASVASLQQRIRDRLASEDSARALGAQRARAFRAAMRTTESAAAKFVQAWPFAIIDPLVPEIVEHNARRAELREVVLAEVRVVIGELSREPTGVWLDRAGVRDLMRESVRTEGVAFVKSFLVSGTFADWWALHSRE